MNDVKILTFNLNAKNNVICDQIYNDQNDLIASQGSFLKREACYNPLFFNDIKQKIIKHQPHLLCFTTEEYQENHYFHTNFLFNELEDYEVLAEYDYRDVLMSIYVLSNVVDDYHLVKKDYFNYGNHINTLCQYIDTPYGIFGFIGFLQRDSPNQPQYKEVSTILTTILNFYKTIDTTYFVMMGYYDRFDSPTIIEATQIYVSPYELKLIDYIDDEFKDEVALTVIYEMISVNTKILCFSWNTDKTPLCDRYYGHQKPDMEKHVRKRFWGDDDCYNPLFFQNIKDQILFYAPDLVAITTEGDLETGTFFHSEFLPHYFKNMGYRLLTNKKQNHIGNHETLRLSIYVRNDVTASLSHLNRTFFSYGETAECQVIVPKKWHGKVYNAEYISKSLVQFVDTKDGVIAFVAINLLHSYNNLNIADCLNKMLTKLLANPKISFIFLMGDFSYPHVTTDLNQAHQIKIGILDQYEEGTNQYVVPNYQFKQLLVSQRQNFNYEKHRYMFKSWHDRIYHRTNGETTSDIICLYYDNLFGFPMLQDNSQHIGILGVYELQPITI
jgi:hypothetical protein